jgi:hypothetical protein
MDIITFQTVIDGEQVIRPPADVVLPQGTLEVTIKPVPGGDGLSRTTRETANAGLRRHRVSLGRATGTNNEGIDADLARAYGDSSKSP